MFLKRLSLLNTLETGKPKLGTWFHRLGKLGSNKFHDFTHNRSAGEAAWLETHSSPHRALLRAAACEVQQVLTFCFVSGPCAGIAHTQYRDNPRKTGRTQSPLYGLSWLIARNTELMRLPWRALNYAKTLSLHIKHSESTFLRFTGLAKGKA